MKIIWSVVLLLCAFATSALASHCPYKCANGGICSKNGTGYACKCPWGYTGQYCRLKLCWIGACFNSGTCIINGPTFICKCKRGYFGPRCQHYNCQVFPCLNNGACRQFPGGYLCICKSGYSGPRCQYSDWLSFCKKNVCKNGGICVERYSLCQCQPGYTGRKCQYVDCRYHHCQNGGSCIKNQYGWACRCLPPYTGSVCAIKRCNCLNGGVCTQNNYRCKCPKGYIGHRCERKICIGSKCRSYVCNYNPCKHGGRCVAYWYSYKCICLPGYTGPYCQYHSCWPNPCQNGGICIRVKNTYMCRCPPGYTGKLCELCLLYLIFLVDESSAVGYGNFTSLLLFITKIICRLHLSSGTISIGVYTYSNRINKQIPFNIYKSKRELLLLIWALLKNYKGGETNTAYGLSYVYQIVKVIKYKATVIVVTGGKSINRETAVQALRVKRVAKKVFVVGVGSVVKRAELILIASSISYVYQTMYSNLMNIATILAFQLCNVYLHPVCYLGTCLNGGICKPYGKLYICVCPWGYTGPRCERYIIPTYCTLNFCKNGGICLILSSGQKICRCPPGFYGTYCQAGKPLYDTCTYDWDCPGGMHCCQRRCKNSVTILSCGMTQLRLSCGPNKKCPPGFICKDGNCISVGIHRCIRCTLHSPSSSGKICCNGCLVYPRKVEVRCGLIDVCSQTSCPKVR